MQYDFRAGIELGEQIGAGYFGAVHVGHDRVLGKVAVKVFKKRDDEDQDYWEGRKQGLLEEGQQLREAEHDHIVRVHQVLDSPQDDAILLVMEFCEHGSLQQEFERGPMSLHRLRDILSDVAHGLHTIHARGLIHRDIKPANILIGAGRRAKLGDFGLVTGDIIYGYASGQGYVDHLAKETHEYGTTSIRTDVWAFGMTAYRLLHGEQFYNKLTPPGELIPEGNFAQRLPWLPHVPDVWRRFIRKLLHDDPDLRFQDAQDILKGLERLSIDPDWDCDYEIGHVHWHRTKDTRRIEVDWTQHSPRKHEWEARSFPLGIGQARRLDGSGGVVNSTVAIRGLEGFFEAQK